MLYIAKKTGRMWDNWLFFHNGKHYLFYLSGVEPEKKIFDLYGQATYDNGVYKNAFLLDILAKYQTRWNGIGIRKNI